MMLSCMQPTPSNPIDEPRRRPHPEGPEGANISDIATGRVAKSSVPKEEVER